MRSVYLECPNCLYGRKVVATPVSLKCEVCELKSRSTALELEMREMKKEMKTLCDKVRKVKRKVFMGKPEEEREVVVQQVSVEGDAGDAGQIKEGQGVRAKERPEIAVEDVESVPVVRRRRKVPVAVIGDSMIRQAAGAVVAEEETCKIACLRGKGIQDIQAEAKQRWSQTRWSSKEEGIA